MLPIRFSIVQGGGKDGDFTALKLYINSRGRLPKKLSAISF